ncbi:hypothetical protein ACHAXT_001269 [Thalassiosira profunda]
MPMVWRVFAGALFLMVGSSPFVRSFPMRGRRASANAINLIFQQRGAPSRSTQTRMNDAPICNGHIFARDICLSGTNSDAIDAPASVSADNDSQGDKSRQLRRERLNHHLTELGVDASALENAAFRAATTTEGFDARFGKSAIKAYRSYIDPKPSKVEAIARENVDVAANRYARQIDFLSKRHRSREAEWVRHIDTSEHRRAFPLVLVLDNVRSAANVGSIYRSADACGCLEILTTGITPHPNGNGAEKLAKSALGAERIVPSRHFLTTRQALEFLRKERPNLLLVGMETTERSKLYTTLQYPGPEPLAEENDDPAQLPGVALFLGNEVSGVDTEILPELDEIVEIHSFGLKNSLNVAACAPVVMFEILRQWGVRNK